VARLRAAAPDLIVVYYFDKALGDEAIAAARSVINVHTALLPRHRGILPEAWPLSFGETEIGVTAHLITDRGIDSGAILDFRRVSVEPGWSVPETSQRANRARVEMLMQLLSQRSRWPDIATVQGWVESLDALVQVPDPHREEEIDRATGLRMLRCDEDTLDELVTRGLRSTWRGETQWFDRFDLFNLGLYSRNRGRDCALDGLPRRLLGQCRRRELLRDAQEGADPPSHLAHP